MSDYLFALTLISWVEVGNSKSWPLSVSVNLHPFDLYVHQVLFFLMVWLLTLSPLIVSSRTRWAGRMIRDASSGVKGDKLEMGDRHWFGLRNETKHGDRGDRVVYFINHDKCRQRNWENERSRTLIGGSCWLKNRKGSHTASVTCKALTLQAYAKHFLWSVAWINSIYWLWKCWANFFL